MTFAEKNQAVFRATAGLWRVVYIRLPRQSVSVRYPLLRWPTPSSGVGWSWPRLGWSLRKVEIPGSAVDGAGLAELMAHELDEAGREGFELQSDLNVPENFSMPPPRGLFRSGAPAQGSQSGGLMLLLKKPSA